MFDAQAWWARDVILGKIALPNKHDMQKASIPWEEKEAAIGEFLLIILFQPLTDS
jgi:trimethylamine monooxygenase